MIWGAGILEMACTPAVRISVARAFAVFHRVHLICFVSINVRRQLTFFVYRTAVNWSDLIQHGQYFERRWTRLYLISCSIPSSLTWISTPSTEYQQGISRDNLFRRNMWKTTASTCHHYCTFVQTENSQALSLSLSPELVLDRPMSSVNYKFLRRRSARVNFFRDTKSAVCGWNTYLCHRLQTRNRFYR